MPETVIVQVGDSIPSLAVDYGFFWRTIWEFGQNAQLKALRKNPNVLLPGDEVQIPDKQERHTNKPVDAMHKFKRKGEPAVIRLQFKEEDEPLANEPYVINFDSGRIMKNGTLDADGILEQVIPGNAKTAEVSLRNGKIKQTFNIGHLNPVDEIIGVQQRLNNLGCGPCPEDNQLSEQLADAIKRFQARNNLDQTGQVDAALKAKLQEMTQ